MSGKREEKDDKELERGVKFRKLKVTKEETPCQPSRKFFLTIPDGAAMLLDTRRNAFDKKRKHTKSQRPCKAMKKPAECILGIGFEALEEMWALADSCHTAVTEDDHTYLQQLQMENSDGCIRFMQTDMNGALASSEKEGESSIPNPSGTTTPYYVHSEMVRSGKIVPPSLVLNSHKRSSGTGKGSTTESNKLLMLLSECGGSANESLLLRLQQPHKGSMNDTIDDDEHDVSNTDTMSVPATTVIAAGTVRRKDHGKNKPSKNGGTNNNINNMSTPLQSEPSKETDVHHLTTRRQWLCSQLGRMMALDGDVNPFPALSSSCSPLSDGLTNRITLTTASSSSSSSHYSRAKASTISDDHSSHDDNEEVEMDSLISNGHSSSDYHTLRLGKRGRRYREVWEEEDYLSSLLLNRPSLPPQGTAGSRSGTGNTKQTKTEKGKETVSVRSLQPLEDWSELIQSYSDTHDGYYRDWSVYYAYHIATLMKGTENEAKTAAKLSANPVVQAMADRPGDNNTTT